MKRISLFATILTAAMVVAFVPTTTVSAADNADTSAQTGASTAEFTVNAGDLTLVSVPNLQFGNVNVADLQSTGATTYTLQQSGSTVAGTQSPTSAADDTPQGNSTGDLTVNDYRGTNSGWKLTASLSQFANGASTLSGTIVLSDLTMTNSVSATIPTIQPAAIASNATPTPWDIEVAAKDAGQGSNTATITGSTLELNKSKEAVDGTYDATMTWTLTNAPA